jgi:hypothetical protein
LFEANYGIYNARAVCEQPAVGGWENFRVRAGKSWTRAREVVLCSAANRNSKISSGRKEFFALTPRALRGRTSSQQNEGAKRWQNKRKVETVKTEMN